MRKTLIAIAKLLIGAAIAIVIIVVLLVLLGNDERALRTIALVFFLAVALIRTMDWSTNLLVPARKSMPPNSKNRATVILGVPYVIGFFLIWTSGWDPLTEHSIPWNTVAQTIGAALMAAALGLGAASARRVGGWVILVALVVMAAIPVLWIIQEGWRTELITLFGVIIGVLIAEGVLSPMLRRWCP